MILHIDMDAFYASIEQRDRPELRGRPVAVGGSSTGRGVVSAASYEARKYGVHSAMPGRKAAQLCPDLIFVRGNLAHYADVGRQVREIFHRFTPLVQPLSLDEAFLDVSGSERLFGDAASIGDQIKAAIDRELQLTASVGVAPLKFVAKIASDLEKPNGFCVVDPDRVQEFLDPLPIGRLWGVGRVGQAKLHRMGCQTIADLRVVPQTDLQRQFGSWGDHLWRLANAIDPRQVVPDRQAKQISHERTFHYDLEDIDSMSSVVSHLSEQTSRRLRRHGRKAKSVTLKYRREDFHTFSRSQSLANPTDSTRAVFQTAMELLKSMRQKEPRPVRLIGVSLASLTEPGAKEQLSLFDLSEGAGDEKKVDQVVDQLADKIGNSAVYRATSHRWLHRKRP